MSARNIRRLAAVLITVPVIALAVFAARASATSDGASAVSGNTVSAAIDYPFPPWEYMAKDGKLTGFDVDIAKAIGRATGLTFVFHQQSFDGIIPGIQAGKYDLSISDITDNADREKVVSFVDYAVQKGGALLVAAGNPQHLAGPLTWCGKTFAIQAGTSASTTIAGANKICKSHGKPNVDAKTYASNASAELAVKSGVAAANPNDGPSIAYTAKTTNGGKSFSVVYYTASWNSTPSLDGIAVSKDQPQLIQQMKNGLNKIIKSGAYRKIAAKYGFLPFAVKSARVNGGG